MDIRYSQKVILETEKQRQKQCFTVISKIQSFHSHNKFRPNARPLKRNDRFRSKAMDLRTRQTRTVRDNAERVTAKCEEAGPRAQ